MYRIWKFVFNSMIQVVIVNALVLPLLLAQSVLAQSTQPQSPGQIKATIKFALKGHTRPIGYNVFSPDGRSIITMGYDETARIWDVASLKSRGSHCENAMTVFQNLALVPPFPSVQL